MRNPSHSVPSKASGRPLVSPIGIVSGQANRDKPSPEAENQQHREQYPSIDAGVQIFFRTALISLHITALILIVVAGKMTYVSPYACYFGMGYRIVLNLVEFVSLTVPFCHFKGHFPRLPSIWLAAAEFTAALSIGYIMYFLLLPSRSRDVDPTVEEMCPKMQCVLPEERMCIMAYGCEILSLSLHLGFFAMASTLWLKRQVPRWVDYWEARLGRPN